MSEETKIVESQNQPKETPTEKNTETPQVEKAKEMTFTQDQLNNIIQQRLEAEKAKHQRQIDEVKKAEENALKQIKVKD